MGKIYHNFHKQMTALLFQPLRNVLEAGQGMGDFKMNLRIQCYSENKIHKRTKKNIVVLSLRQYICKILNKRLASRTHMYFKRIICHHHMETILVIQGWFSIKESIKIIYSIKRSIKNYI